MSCTQSFIRQVLQYYSSDALMLLLQYWKYTSKSNIKVKMDDTDPIPILCYVYTLQNKFAYLTKRWFVTINHKD